MLLLYLSFVKFASTIDKFLIRDLYHKIHLLPKKSISICIFFLCVMSIDSSFLLLDLV
jgi:hypothetical protein